MTTDANVMLWGTRIGVVSWFAERGHAAFQYTLEFLPSGIEVAPLTMPLREAPYAFPALSRETFLGLPGLLVDSLPDRFGNALIDEWLAREGRSASDFTPVERLCYVGVRGMGALEFEPAIQGPPTSERSQDIAQLVRLSNAILKERAGMAGRLTPSDEDDHAVLEDILRVGTSAGGARAKAVLAWNPETGEFRSGQLPAGSGFEYWLLKFDGVSDSDHPSLAGPQGYGQIEYAYHLMAVAAGISMEACRLHHEGGRCHFMTRRFDRTPDGGKLHMQSLGAMAHFDYQQPSSWSYEQAVHVLRRLGVPHSDLEELVRRAIFNVVARNCDDHVKNISFLMNRQGMWRLSPAYDLAFAWNPSGIWTARHQMSVAGKRDVSGPDAIRREDLVALASMADIKTAAANRMVDEVIAAAHEWPSFARQAGLPREKTEYIGRHLRLDL